MSTVSRICNHCGVTFPARTADVKRGWANFCSKSCKAKKQESKTGQNRAYHARREAAESNDIPDFDGSWDAHKDWTP